MARNLLRYRKYMAASLAITTIATGSLTACSTENTSNNASNSISATANGTVYGAENADIFDLTSEHSINLEIAEDDLQTMLEDYQTSEDKTWVSATVTIDGVVIENVGVRLKGNSTLRSLSTDASAGGAGGAANADEAPAAAPNGGLNQMEPGGMNGTAPEGMAGMAPEAMDEDATVDVNDPTTWPLLISFDKYVDGQTYQGFDQISIRPGTTVINEYLATELISATGQPSEESGFVTLSINDSATTTRPIIEIPDDAYAAKLGNGILFKAKSESSFTYQGDDVTTYEDQFKDINGNSDDDYQPLIELLKWIEEADDATFDAELENYVDVESFAKYLASQNLLLNSDDMAGAGNNYYLWYDNDTELFSVIVWDLNLSMMLQTNAGPDENVSMGPSGESIPIPSAAGAGARPNGGMGELGQTTPPDGMNGNGMTPPDGAATDATPAANTTGNILKERFLASEKFYALYLDAFWELYDQMLGDGTAEDLLENLANEIPTSDAVSADEITAAVRQIQEWG